MSRATLENTKQEIERLNQQIKDMAETRKLRRLEQQEDVDRQNALRWLRGTLFPYFQGLATQNGTSIADAAQEIVQKGIRFDVELDKYWSSPEAAGLLDSTAGRLMLSMASFLLNESDEATANRAQWLLNRVLPKDPVGAQIQRAFISNQNGPRLWLETIVGIKRVVAARQQMG